MNIEEKLQNLEGQICEIMLLQNILLNALKYQEMELTSGSSFVYLCEIIDEKFKTITNLF